MYVKSKAILAMANRLLNTRPDASSAEAMRSAASMLRDLAVERGQSEEAMRKLVEDAYRAGFIEACRWPEPVTQDADSKALGDRMREWIDKQERVRR